MQDALASRFTDAPLLPEGSQTALLKSMATRGSCRAFADKPVPAEWIEAISALAMSAPTKSDMQQRDIVVLKSPDIRKRLADLVSGQSWVADAPMIAVFCGNNRRQRLLHDWHDVPFANDHLDAFFNAAGDAAIALGAFVTAAEAMGLGCCPISAVRNEADAVSDRADRARLPVCWFGIWVSSQDTRGIETVAVARDLSRGPVSRGRLARGGGRL